MVDELDDWVSGTWKWLLLDSGLTPDPAAQTFVSDINGDEVVGAGYTRVTASGKSVSNVGASDFRVRFYLVTDPDFGSPTGGAVATWVCLYREVTVDADSPIAAVWAIN